MVHAYMEQVGHIENEEEEKRNTINKKTNDERIS